MVAYVPLLAVLVGLLLFFLSSKPKVTDVGKVLFAAGLLVLLLTLATHTVGIGVR